jgi:large subunit ribosomal protein L15
MKLDEILHRAGKHKRANRIGRGTGSGQGKTAGRGTKGYYSRSGAVHRLNYEGGQTTIFARMPKRGFSNVQFASSYQVVNVGELEVFPEGSRVDGAALAKAGLIAHAAAPVKVLGDGRLRRKLTVAARSFSVSAIKKITKAGGAALTPSGEPVNLPPPPAPKPVEDRRKDKGGAGREEGEAGKAKEGGKGREGAPKAKGGKGKEGGKPKDVAREEDKGKEQKAP